MANRFFVNGGVNNNWSDTSNWSASSGGAGGVSVPTSSDAAFLDVNSPNCNIDTGGTRACAGLDCTNYVNTLNHNATIQVSGPTTLSSGMTFTTSNTSSLFQIMITSTITSNGKFFPATLKLGNTTAITITLADNVQTTNFNVTANASTTVTCNGNQLKITGNIDFGSASTITLSGTTTYLHSGTGTYTQTATSGFNAAFTVDTGSILTISGTMNMKGGSFTNNGTIVSTGSTLLITSVAVTLNLSTATLNNVNFNGNATVTLSSDLTLSGNLSLGSSGGTTTVNGNSINISGNYTCNSDTGGKVVGTTELKLVGAGIITNGTGFTGSTCINMTVNSTGIYYLSADFYYSKNTFKVVTPNNFVALSGSFLRITNADASTCTIDGSFTLANFRPASSSVVFTGDIIFTESFQGVGTAASMIVYSSSVGGVQRKLTILPGALIDVGFVNTIDIDSGDGKTVYSYRGTSFSNTINWQVLSTEGLTKKVILK